MGLFVLLIQTFLERTTDCFLLFGRQMGKLRLHNMPEYSLGLSA